MTAERAAIINEAMRWNGTPFIHDAEVLGAGVDCAHLIAAVYKKFGVLPQDFKFPIYGQDWFRHADREDKYIIELGAPYFTEVTEKEAEPGDWLCVKMGRAYAHCAIIVELPRRVLCAWPTRSKVAVVNYKEDRIFKDRPTRFFSPFKK